MLPASEANRASSPRSIDLVAVDKVTPYGKVELRNLSPGFWRESRGSACVGDQWWHPHIGTNHEEQAQ